MSVFFEFVFGILSRMRFVMVVPPPERGVRVRLGTRVREIGPGVHFIVPWVDEVETLNVMPQVIDLPDQSLDTQDGTSVIVSGSVEYEITDVQKALLEIQDFESSLVTFGNGIIAQEVYGYVYRGSDTGLFDLQERIHQSLIQYQDEWGIDVVGFYLTSFTKNRVLRLLS